MNLILQTGINPKDWSMLPPVIIAIGFLAVVGAYVAKQLGLVANRDSKKPEPMEIQSGAVSESKWILNITNIVRTENEKLRQDIKEHLKENFEETHKCRNSVLALQGFVSESERNVLEAIEKTKETI